MELLNKLASGYLITFMYGLSILIALVLHELGHATVSHLLGDPTPKNEGRLTLNPLKHLDLIGTLCMVILGFGWAKPVQINPQYYKNRKIGTVYVSLAGPCTNFLLGFIGTILLKCLPNASLFLTTFIGVNISLGVFNLIPIPPLDGSKILSIILPEDLYFKFISLGQYGMFILILTLSTGVLRPILTFLVSWVYKLYDFLLFFL